MAIKQQAIINNQLISINSLSQPFKYDFPYKPVLTKALKALDNIPPDLNKPFQEEYLMEVRQHIINFSYIVSHEVKNLVRSSIRQAPVGEHIIKIVMANRMLSKTEFADHNQEHIYNIEQIKYLYKLLSQSKFR
jgi:hypothetical protein